MAPHRVQNAGSRSSGQVMQWPPPRPLPSSKPSIVITSMQPAHFGIHPKGTLITSLAGGRRTGGQRRLALAPELDGLVHPDERRRDEREREHDHPLPPAERGGVEQALEHAE